MVRRGAPQIQEGFERVKGAFTVPSPHPQARHGAPARFRRLGPGLAWQLPKDARRSRLGHGAASPSEGVPSRDAPRAIRTTGRGAPPARPDRRPGRPRPPLFLPARDPRPENHRQASAQWARRPDGGVTAPRSSRVTPGTARGRRRGPSAFFAVAPPTGPEHASCEAGAPVAMVAPPRAGVVQW